MRTLCQVAVLVLSFALCIPAASAHVFGQPTQCERYNIPLQMLDGGGLNGKGLKVVSHHLSFGEPSQGSLALVNETGKTITKVLVLVSYLDSDGKAIFAIPYFGGLDDSEVEIQQIRPYVKTILDHPVKHGEGFFLFGDNLESTRQVPADAAVTFVDTEFDDDSNSVTTTTPETDTLVLKVPDFFEMNINSSKLPDELLLTIAVDERGRVVEVNFDPSFPHSDDVESQIRAQLKLWSFFPATIKGYAVQAYLNLLFRFHDTGFPLPLPMCPLDLADKYPRTFVKVDLRSQGDGRWLAMYGGQYAHGSFDTIVSVTLPTTKDDCLISDQGLRCESHSH